MQPLTFQIRNIRVRVREWSGLYLTCFRHAFTFGCTTGILESDTFAPRDT